VVLFNAGPSQEYPDAKEGGEKYQRRVGKSGCAPASGDNGRIF
jgi:hypothetical protein